MKFINRKKYFDLASDIALALFSWAFILLVIAALVSTLKASLNGVL